MNPVRGPQANAARVPKIALPTRTSVAPIAIAVSKSPLIPIDSDVEPEPLRDFGEQREVRRHDIVDRRNAHQPVDREPVHVAAARDERIHVAGKHARLLRLLARIDLHEQAEAPPLLLHLRRDRAGDLVAVDGVDGIEQRHRVRRLVRLQRTDEVQSKVGKFRFQRRPFRLRFLHAVLAEVALAGRDHRPDGVGVERLGDRDQPHRAGRPPGGRLRRANPLPHPAQS